MGCIAVSSWFNFRKTCSMSCINICTRFWTHKWSLIPTHSLDIIAEGTHTNEITLINQSHIPQHHLQGTKPTHFSLVWRFPLIQAVHAICFPLKLSVIKGLSSLSVVHFSLPLTCGFVQRVRLGPREENTNIITMMVQVLEWTLKKKSSFLLSDY